ncbi:MAG TPA: hypothetical protein VHX39_25825, partial [Acetobacteraceae bacterium]|nr:hypothetical protein [Acetobacteraceae bacterium]
MSGSSSTVAQQRVWASSGTTYNSLPKGYRPILVPSEANIRMLWEKANTNAQAALGIAKTVGKMALRAAPGATTLALGVTAPIGAVFDMVIDGKAALSTSRHIDKLVETELGKCSCGYCEEMVEYVLRKKGSKLIRRGTRAATGIISGGTLITIGEKLKGMYKMAMGTRGVNREAHAVVLWVTAKNGCQCAQDITAELVGSPSTMIATLNNYEG